VSQRDSIPDDLKLWRAAGVPVDPELQDACRSATVRAIERAMDRAQRLRGRQRWLRGVLFAAAVAAVGTGAFLFATTWGDVSPPDSGQGAVVVEARAQVQKGTAEVTRNRERHVLFGEHSIALSAGDFVRVGTLGSLVVALPDRAVSQWRADTELDVREVQAERQAFNLRRGHVAIDIPPDSPPRHLVVSTPHVDVVVVGTILDVSVIEKGDEQVTEVRVQRGHVKLTHAERTVAKLAAGEFWSSRKPKPAVDEPSEPKETDTSAAVTARAPAPTQSDASTLKDENRLYRAALDARNAGGDELAVRLLSQLLQQYPTSPLAQEAKVERFRALRRLGRAKEASEAARRYLAEYGDGFARKEARETALPARSE
jgi:hypothetical protein